jgi:hypothetical protein
VELRDCLNDPGRTSAASGVTRARSMELGQREARQFRPTHQAQPYATENRDENGSGGRVSLNVRPLPSRYSLQLCPSPHG